MRRFGKLSLVIVGAWTLIGLATGLNSYLINHGFGGSAPLGATLYRSLGEHWIWAILTPLVLWVSHRLPFTKQSAGRAFCGHVAFFLAISLTHSAIAHLVGLPLRYSAKGFAWPVVVLRFQQEFYSDIWMYWPLVCIQNLIEYYKKYRDRELRAVQLESQLTRSELQLLRAQVQPHFLFNTLNSISALIQDDPQGAEDMIADLSEMFRASTLSTGVPEVALCEEIAMVRAYVRIQKKRLGDRLTVIFDVAPETLACKVPSLLLQPLVENAINYAAAPCPDPTTIRIRAARSGDSLRLEVSDDGPGLPDPYREGIGIGNSRARLRQMYSGHQTFQLVNDQGRGLSVQMTIPFHEVLEPDEKVPV